MPWGETSADPSKFQEAIDSHTKRVVMTPEQARTLDDRTRQEAFWVGGGLQLAQIQRVFDALTASIEKGETFADFKARVRGDLSNPSHVETVFRNAAQRAYNAGRYAQMTEPNTLKFRPYWLFDIVFDGRTTKTICLPRRDTLLPADHPWWDSNHPPLHHRCRTSVRNLRRSEAEKRGITETPNGEPTPAGFGISPRLYAGPIKPNPAKTDPALLTELERKAVTGTKTRKPRAPKEHTAKHWLPEYKRYGDAASSVAHGRAAYERGLDMTVAAAREQLRKVDAPGFAAMRDALQDADANRTVREQAGETDPLRKAAAAAAGHLATLKAHPQVQHAQLERLSGGKTALDRLSALTGPSVKHPGADWVFTTAPKGIGETSPAKKRVRFDPDVKSGILEHELGHVFEQLNPTLEKRAKAFLLARTKGEKLKPYGKQGGHTVLARLDRFLHYYVGRSYEDPDGTVYATEITSTALELLIASKRPWGRLEELARVDFEHLLFLLGQLGGE